MARRSLGGTCYQLSTEPQRQAMMLAALRSNGEISTSLARFTRTVYPTHPALALSLISSLTLTTPTMWAAERSAGRMCTWEPQFRTVGTILAGQGISHSLQV